MGQTGVAAVSCPQTVVKYLTHTRAFKAYNPRHRNYKLTSHAAEEFTIPSVEDFEDFEAMEDFNCAAARKRAKALLFLVVLLLLFGATSV